MNEMYPEEILGEDDDNGTMSESRAKLEQAVVGHRIVNVERNVLASSGYYNEFDTKTVLTLDNGKKVSLRGTGDCCAYTEVDDAIFHIDKMEHAITGVGTTDGYTTWHIYADLGDVVELQVGWSCGNPFYYGYGFTIQVEDA